MYEVFDIELVINKLKSKRKLFNSKSDFVLSMASVIKEEYRTAMVKLGYVPGFDYNMYIDILVVMGSKWFPIKLRYKTNRSVIIDVDEVFNLKNDSNIEVDSYLYLKDIKSLEKMRDNFCEFEEGYVVFLTNNFNYENLEKSNYRQFLLEDGLSKCGVLKCENYFFQNYESPIILQDLYAIKWREYSRFDDDIFKYLVNIVKKSVV